MTALVLRPKEGNLKLHQIGEDYSELDCKVGSQITLRNKFILQQGKKVSPNLAQNHYAT